jgi:hypothetical protein
MLKKSHKTAAIKGALKAKKKQCAIDSDSTFGPRFGDDIRVSGHWNAGSYGCTSCLGGMYTNDAGLDKKTFLTGSVRFILRETFQPSSLLIGEHRRTARRRTISLWNMRACSSGAGAGSEPDKRCKSTKSVSGSHSTHPCAPAVTSLLPERLADDRHVPAFGGIGSGHVSFELQPGEYSIMTVE